MQKKKLNLQKETFKSLTPDQLNEVAGGNSPDGLTILSTR